MVKKLKIRLSKKIILICLAVVALGAGATLLSVTVYRDHQVVRQAQTTTVRELILQAVKALKPEAPIDAKTGDIYFPEARLYLPARSNPDFFIHLTYSYSQAENDAPELSISNTAVLNKSAVKLYTAENMDEVFDAVPKLQSCSRGIRLLYNQPKTLEANLELKQTVVLNNNRTLYMYLENTCPDLNDTLSTLKDIRAY